MSISVDYTPPPDFDYDPTLKQYRAASGPLTLTCEVAGNSGPLAYTWVTPWNQYWIPSTTRTYSRRALHSDDNGRYTCTATDAGGSSGEASTTVKIVGIVPVAISIICL